MTRGTVVPADEASWDDVAAILAPSTYATFVAPGTPHAVCSRGVAIRPSCVESRQIRPATLNRWHRRRLG